VIIECPKCKWVKTLVVHELPPSLHCTTPKPLHRSSACRGPICTSLCCTTPKPFHRSSACRGPICMRHMSAKSTDVTTSFVKHSSLKFRYKRKMTRHFNIIQKISPGMRTKGCPWWVCVIRKVTVHVVTIRGLIHNGSTYVQPLVR
jgi:hypothetical protein